MQASEFAALLHAKQLRRGHWIARCPAHPDKRPSLSIAEGRKQPVVFKCMSAGCTQDEVLKAMGLTWHDLLGDRPKMTHEMSAHLQDEQTLRSLRDLKRAVLSPMGAVACGTQAKMEAVIRVIDRNIVVVENRLHPEIKAIRDKEAKTDRFVRKWGWDKLWELFFVKNPQ